MYPQVGVIYSAEVNKTAQDEFVETQYYKQLVSIDKDHHTVLLQLIFIFPLLLS